LGASEKKIRENRSLHIEYAILQGKKRLHFSAFQHGDDLNQAPSL
jgi:hypothetical protein